MKVKVETTTWCPRRAPRAVMPAVPFWWPVKANLRSRALAEVFAPIRWASVAMWSRLTP
jgi:hypothetical protein